MPAIPFAPFKIWNQDFHAHIGLYSAKLPFETVNVSFSHSEQTQAFSQLSSGWECVWGGA